MYEPHIQPLLPKAKFLLRMAWHAVLASGIVLGGLGIGVLGYHEFEGLPWLDSLLNASMILGGMGPVNALQTTAGKWFASCYALFAGLVFVVTCGVIFAPLIHRFLHRFHLDMQDDDMQDDDTAG